MDVDRDGSLLSSLRGARMSTQVDPHLKWLNKAEHWGEWERFDEVTGERESIWMMKSTNSPDVRFYAVGKGEVSRHKHVVAATYWAYGTGYLRVVDPAEIFLEIGCRQEVMAGGVSREPYRVEDMA